MTRALAGVEHVLDDAPVRHGLAGVAATDGSWSWMRGVGIPDPDRVSGTKWFIASPTGTGPGSTAPSPSGGGKYSY